MARLSRTLLIACCFAIVAQCIDCKACSGGGTAIKLQQGKVANGNADAASAANQLAAAIAGVVNLHQGCKVQNQVKIQSACQKAVKAGDQLEGADGPVPAAGTLFDLQIVESIKCPDGSYKVQYEARGVKPNNSDTLVSTQTRFIKVLDSTYLANQHKH